MADVILYVHPNATTVYPVDFQDVLPSADSAIAAVGSGSSVTGVKSNGDSAADILTGATISSKVLSVTIHNVVEGEEYLLTFLGQGATSGERRIKTVQVLARRNLTGEF